MAIKINRVQINNFKVFENFQVEFKGSDFIVLDGPNGFGKTSFYDAIEFLLTGKVRRYEELVDTVIKGAKGAERHPFLNDKRLESKIDDYLTIKCELDINGETVCLMRRKAIKVLRNKLHLRNDYKIPLFVLNNFDDKEGESVDDEVTLLTGYLGEDYIRNFEFLNYMEQQENICLLKKNNVDRQASLDHLFNTSEFQKEIENLSLAKTNIAKLCVPAKQRELEQQEKRLKEFQAKSLDKKTEISYKKCFPWKKILLDVEELDFTVNQYIEWLGEEGELSKLECFRANLNDFKKERENKKLLSIFEDEERIIQLLLYGKFLNKLEKYDKTLVLRKNINEFLNAFQKGVSYAIENSKVDLSEELEEILKTSFDIKKYSVEIAKIKSLKNSASELTSLLVDLKDARNILIEKFKSYEIETEAKDTCPLCGYSWEDAEKLKLNFDNQEKKLEELIKESGQELNVAIKSFNETYLTPIKEFLKGMLPKETIDELFVKELKKAKANRADLKRLHRLFKDFSVNLNPFLNRKPEIATVDLPNLRALVESKRVAYESKNIQNYFPSMFLKYFEENFDNVSSIKKGDIENKRRYIEWQYSIFQSAALMKNQKKYEEEKGEFEKAKSLRDKLKNIITIYEDSLAEYNEKIIKGIEILFHIYSGRIMQETQGGLGIFINADGKKISFIESHDKNLDVIFTMSSGQLSALIIAFTLALNKRYSQNELLFIDDPVQTLDDLNFAGFVELLRNDFSGRQIFISTHEDMMSAYMRYKFDKFNLSTQQVNFKDKMLTAK